MLPSKAALSEQDILSVIDALLANRLADATVTPLHRKVIDYICACTSVDLLTPLAEHPCVEVRCAVAFNPQLSDELVWKLAYDADFRVRTRLAENQKLPTFVLETLAEDEDDRVAYKATKTLDKLNSNRLANKVIHWMFGSPDMKKTG